MRARKSIGELNADDAKWLGIMAYVMPVVSLVIFTLVYFFGELDDKGLLVFKVATVWMCVAGFFAFKFLAKKAATKAGK